MSTTRGIRKKSGKSVTPKSQKEERTIPVICVTGSPGCGKTTLSVRIQEELGIDDYTFINVGELIKEKKLYDEWDDEMNCSIFDDDLVRREVRRIISKSQEDGKKGVLIEFHSLSFLRKKMFDRIVVLRTDNSVLWDRLEKRGYPEKKIQENVQAEIFMECYNECVDEFDDEVVEQRDSNTDDDMKDNIRYISKLLVMK